MLPTSTANRDKVIVLRHDY